MWALFSCRCCKLGSYFLCGVNEQREGSRSTFDVGFLDIYFFSVVSFQDLYAGGVSKGGEVTYVAIWTYLLLLGALFGLLWVLGVVSILRGDSFGVTTASISDGKWSYRVSFLGSHVWIRSSTLKVVEWHSEQFEVSHVKDTIVSSSECSGVCQGVFTPVRSYGLRGQGVG